MFQSMIKHFGNSLIFGSWVGSLPTMIQPFLFYPDWYFICWPFQVIQAFTTPYPHGNLDLWPVGWGVVWYIVGVICGLARVSDTFDDCKKIHWYPFSSEFFIQFYDKGIAGELAAAPFAIFNIAYIILYKIVVYFLFWHIVMARLTGLVLTLGGLIGYSLSQLIRGLILAVMIIPPVIYLFVQTFFTLKHFLA